MNRKHSTMDSYPLFIIVLVLLFIIFIGASFAGWERWYYRPGDGHEHGYSVLQTPDSGYIVAGWSANTGFRMSAETSLPCPTDLYLLRTDSNGDTLWTRAYGTHAGFELCEGRSIVETYDGGYIIAGNCDFQMYLVKIDSSGDTLDTGWTRVYSGIGSAYEIAQTPDSGYIIAGSTGSDMFLTKITADGESLWTQRYGGTERDEAFSLDVTTDSGYIIAGHTNSFGAGSYDIYVVKTDSIGDTLWTKAYGGSDYDWGTSIVQTSDGGYAVAGYTYSFGAGDYDWYLVKTDSIGDTIWTKTYGDVEHDCCNFIMQTDDGGFLLAGEIHGGTGAADLYIIKTDSTGEISWEQTYGGVHTEIAYWVTQTFDGGYIISGTRDNWSPTFLDLYLCKTDSLGEIDWVKDIPSKPQEFEINAFPNPFNSSCRITVDVGASLAAPATVEIFDLRGNVVTPYSDGKPSSFVPPYKGDRNRALAKVSEGSASAQGIYVWTPDKSISSGVYLIRAGTGEKIVTKRIVHLR